ncbi:MAG TPA: PKD domain-containing protein [Methylomirabilota bacterium]|nr:PKD domain-containing protein [Methylomirabilota bacterium]
MNITVIAVVLQSHVATVMAQDAEEPPPSVGRLQVSIGGVQNRHGHSPYTLSLKALVRGGSGRIKSIDWSLGDGKSAVGQEVQQTFTAGAHSIVVRVEDENGQKASAQLTIMVVSRAPAT